jgi:hypothetical protein
LNNSGNYILFSRQRVALKSISIGESRAAEEDRKGIECVSTRVNGRNKGTNASEDGEAIICFCVKNESTPIGPQITLIGVKGKGIRGK